MTRTAQKLKPQLLELSKRDRGELALFLLDSIGDAEGPDESKEWQAELRRRLQEYKDDPSVGIPGDQVFEELRKKYS